MMELSQLTEEIDQLKTDLARPCRKGPGPAGPKDTQVRSVQAMLELPDSQVRSVQALPDLQRLR